MAVFQWPRKNYILPVALCALAVLSQCTLAAKSDALKVPIDHICSSKCQQSAGDPQRMLTCCFVQLAAFTENLYSRCNRAEDSRSKYSPFVYQKNEEENLGEDFNTGSVDPELVHRMMSYTHLLPPRLPSNAHINRKRLASTKRYGGNYDYGMALPWQMPNGGVSTDGEGDKNVFRYGK